MTILQMQESILYPIAMIKKSNHLLVNSLIEEPTINEDLKSTVKEDNDNDDESNDKNKEASSKVEGSYDTQSSEHGQDYMNLDSIGESLGTFISVAGDKLYDAHMGYNQK